MENKSIKMLIFINGLQVMAEDTGNGIVNPFQLVQKPGPNGKMDLSFLSFAPFADVGSVVKFTQDHILSSYEVTEKSMLGGYQASVEDLRQKKSGIIMPSSKLDLK